MTHLDRVRRDLAELEHRALQRVPRRSVQGGAIDFSFNDYLGLSRDPRVLAPLRESEVVGSGGSRLLGAADLERTALEREFAAWAVRGRALLFFSGYLAAVGGIT